MNHSPDANDSEDCNVFRADLRRVYKSTSSKWIIFKQTFDSKHVNLGWGDYDSFLQKRDDEP